MNTSRGHEQTIKRDEEIYTHITHSFFVAHSRKTRNFALLPKVSFTHSVRIHTHCATTIFQHRSNTVTRRGVAHSVSLSHGSRAHDRLDNTIACVHQATSRKIRC